MSKLLGYAGYGAFSVALIATLSSLVASEVFNLPPCELCWYQRIFMYPLVFIIGLGVMRRDTSWALTTLAIGGIGWVIALYHSLLQWSIIPSTLAPCTGGVSCAEQEFVWFGFVTMPFLSLVAFTVILGLTVFSWKGEKSE